MIENKNKKIKAIIEIKSVYNARYFSKEMFYEDSKKNCTEKIIDCLSYDYD
jgi:hypothetical protein